MKLPPKQPYLDLLLLPAANLGDYPAKLESYNVALQRRQRHCSPKVDS